MTYDMKSEDMDKRALIQQYLNGRLNSAQIAEFTRQLKDPEFCNILSEEREIAEKRQAASQATATMAKVAEAKPLSEQEQETLIDLYVRGDMDSETESRFLNHIKADKELQRQVLLVANIVKGALAEQRQSDMEFGYAMKCLTPDRLEQIIGPRRSASPRHASSNTRLSDRPKMPTQGVKSSRSEALISRKMSRSQGKNFMQYCCHLLGFFDRSDNLESSDSLESSDNLESSDSLESTNSVAADIYERFKPNYAAYGICINVDTLSEACKCLDAIKAAYDEALKSGDISGALAAGKDLAVEYLHIGIVDKFKEILNDLKSVAAHSSSKDDDTLMRDIRLLLALSETI